MYVKVFKSMFDGSLHGQFDATVVFLAMLVIAEREGIVDMTPQAIAARCGYPIGIVQRGIIELEKPDPLSRSPDDDGRRIVKLDPEIRPWGWRIVNYEKYEKIKSAEEKREYFRVKQAEHRSKDRIPSKVSNGVKQCPPLKTHPDPNPELELNPEKDISLASPAHSTDVEIGSVFDHWKLEWHHPKAHLDPKRKRLIGTALKSFSVDELRSSISGYLKSAHHTGDNDQAKVYDEIGLFLRDAAHIEAGIAFAQQPITKKHRSADEIEVDEVKKAHANNPDISHEAIANQVGVTVDAVRRALSASP